MTKGQDETKEEEQEEEERTLVRLSNICIGFDHLPCTVSVEPFFSEMGILCASFILTGRGTCRNGYEMKVRSVPSVLCLL